MKKDEIENKEIKIVLFYMDGCPHCETTLESLEEIIEDHKDWQIVKIDAEEKDDELLDDLEIEGFPTMFFYVRDEKKMVDGSKTADEIEEIVEDM